MAIFEFKGRQPLGKVFHSLRSPRQDEPFLAVFSYECPCSSRWPSHHESRLPAGSHSSESIEEIPDHGELWLDDKLALPIDIPSLLANCSPSKAAAELPSQLKYARNDQVTLCIDVSPFPFVILNGRQSFRKRPC